jgi:nucleoside-diphosphate-sugar epimerase
MFSYTNARRNNLFQTAFANQIIKIQLGKQKFLSHGNLNSLRTFVDIEDAMEAYWLAATKGKIGEIYNIGGDDIISVKNYLKELISLSGKKILCKLDKKLLRPTDILVQIPDSTKFRKHTGWKPAVSFRESIKKFYMECKKNVR